jgi:glutamate synthase (NADPH/NADH) large chain
MSAELPGKIDKKEIVKRYIKAIDKGLLKVMSKMGISTYQSYCGAQIFDAVGLKADFVAKYFTGTATRIEGVGLNEIAEEAVQRHRDAFGDSPVFRGMLDVGGEYAVRVRGEDHVWNATTVSTLQHAVRGNSQDKYRAFAKILNEQDTLVTIRGLFRVKTAAEDERKPVPIEEVEPAKTIVKRFATGAMSFGSISREAHTTLAIAMNRIGGKSNTGEGGRKPTLQPLPNEPRSVRSGDHGCSGGSASPPYLVNSDMMNPDGAEAPSRRRRTSCQPQGRQDHRQGATRHRASAYFAAATACIYSIEDLAQLIFDLKNVNPTGAVSVKLVSEVGVGTVAAGVRPRRPCDLRLRGRHRRIPSPRSACRLAVGDRPRRDASDAGGQSGSAAASPCRSTAASAPAAMW